MRMLDERSPNQRRFSFLLVAARQLTLLLVVTVINSEVSYGQQQKDQDIASRMAGIWETTAHQGQRYKVETSGNKFELFLISYDNYRRHTKQLMYYGIVLNGNISGYYNLTTNIKFEQTDNLTGRSEQCTRRAGAHTMDRGSVSPDGNRLSFYHTFKDENPNCTPNEINYVFVRVQ